MFAHDQSWTMAAPQAKLAESDVHVWLVPIDHFTSTSLCLEQFLSSDEYARANRFHFERDRQSFITVRGILRILLAGYLNTAPGVLRFQQNTYGKPALLNETDALRLEFNVSHSGRLALIAIARGRALGVDIEHKRPLADADAIAAAYFSANERTAIHALTGGTKVDAFYACWTRKEAYIKAIGRGLFMPLDQFDVTLAPDEPACLLRVHNAQEELARWTLYSLDPAPGYAGALVAEGTSHHICYWRLPEALYSLF